MICSGESHRSLFFGSCVFLIFIAFTFICTLLPWLCGRNRLRCIVLIYSVPVNSPTCREIALIQKGVGGYRYHIRHQKRRKAKIQAAMSNTASETLSHLEVVLSQWSEGTLTLVPISMDMLIATLTEVEIQHGAPHQLAFGSQCSPRVSQHSLSRRDAEINVLRRRVCIPCDNKGTDQSFTFTSCFPP